MADPNVREIGVIEDFHGIRLTVGVDYDCITVGPFTLDSAQTIELLLHMTAAMVAVQNRG